MTPTGFRLGEFVVEPATDRLLRVDTGARIDLEPKTMDVLVALAKQPGEVVSSPALIECVWRGRPMGDNPVYKAIAKLRRALQDEAGAPRYIETIPRKGYRLLMTPVPVEPMRVATEISTMEAGRADGLAVPHTQAVGRASVPERQPHARHWRATLAIIAVVATGSAVLFHRSSVPETVARPTRGPEHVTAAPTAPVARPVAREAGRRPVATG